MKYEHAIPLSIISGFLGCGKTTLINKIIKRFPDKNLGIIVNEFGDAKVESQLIHTSNEQIVELSNGCMCCVVRTDFLSAVETLITEKPDLDYLLVEASGLSDPVPVAQTFLHNDLDGKIRFDTIINLIDTSNIMQNFNKFNIIMQQTKLADFVFLTKLDLSHPRSIEFAKAFIKNLGRKTKVYELNDHFDVAPFFQFTFKEQAQETTHEEILNYDEHFHNDKDIKIVHYQTSEIFDYDKLKDFFQLELKGIIRAKGIISCKGNDTLKKTYLIQAVGEKRKMIEQEDFQEKSNSSVIIIIGVSISKDKISKAIESCLV